MSPVTSSENNTPSSRERPARLIPVVVTGVGPVSAIGIGRDAYWQSLLFGRPGFGPITLCDTDLSSSKIAAEVRGFRLADHFDDGRALARRTPRPVQMGLAATALALRDAGIDLDNLDRDRVGVHVGTSVGNLGAIMSASARYRGRRTLPSPFVAFHSFNHSAACVISSSFDLRGPLQTTSTGCNSGLDALGQSLRAIQAGLADAILVVGTDCEVVAEILAVLNASGALSTRYNDTPECASRPFEKGRDGSVIGEGAGALLLEAEPHAVARGAHVYARVAGHRVCAAGNHRQYQHENPQVDLRPCVRALRGVMDEAGWEDGDVDLVNANGSSSVLYDRFEALALAETLGPRFPEVRVHSTKSMLGQHGAGSSALQAIAACLAIDQGKVPPTINYDEPDPACGPIRVVTRAEPYAASHVLVHSIGLGGFYYSAAAFTSANGTP